MPKTTWELELKARGGAGAKRLARDLRELDGALRALGDSSAVLKSIASDAAALRGARVRIAAEKSVGDAMSRQQMRARTEMTDSERLRRAVAAGQTRMAEQEGQRRYRAWQQQQRNEGKAAQMSARLNSQAYARDQVAMRSQERLRARLAEQGQRSRERFQAKAAAREQETVSSIVGGLGVAFGAATAISAATMSALGFIADMVSAVGRLALNLGVATLEMIGFREATLATLRGTARDASGRHLRGAAADAQANERFDFAQQFARETPLDVEQVLGLQRQVSAAGFTGTRNRDVVMAAADVGAGNLSDPTAAHRFTLGLGQLRNASSVRTQDLRQTAEAAGLNENDLLRQIAQGQGVTQRRGETDRAYNARVQAMQRAGRIRGGDEAVSGVLAGLREHTGRDLGGEARAQGNTLLGTLSNLRGAVKDFVYSIRGIENLPGIQALKTTLNDIVRVITGTGPTATRLKALFAGIVDQSARWVSELAGPDGIVGTVNHIIDRAEALYPVVRDIAREFGGNAWEAFKTGVGPVLEQLTGLGADPNGTVAFAAQLGTALGTILGFGVRVTAWMVDFTATLAIGAGYIIQVVDAVRGLVSSIGDLIAMPWAGIGSAIVDGMRDGFLGPSQGFVSEVGNWSNDIANASRANLGVHSPSRVFRDIGVQIPAGMAEGIDSGAGDVERALGGMVAPPSLPNFGALSGLAGMGGISAVFNITVEGGSNDTGREIGEAAWSAFADRFELANAMAGG